MGARLLGLIFAAVLLSAGCEQVTSASEPEAEAEQLPEIARRAIKHPVVRRNPRKLETAEQVLEILQLAF